MSHVRYYVGPIYAEPPSPPTITLTVHDPEHHVTFTQNIRDIHVTWMRTSMNNPIHIEIQMIKLGKKRRIGNNLIDLGVSFTNPSVKLGRKNEQN
jgi:hypothetical protein